MFGSLFRVIVRRLSLPDNLIDEVRLAENLIQENLNVMAGVPVAVIEKASGALQNPRQFDTAWSHEVDVSLRRCVPIVKGPHLTVVVPEDFVVSV
jgi:hypothetical protein